MMQRTFNIEIDFSSNLGDYSQNQSEENKVMPEKEKRQPIPRWDSI